MTNKFIITGREPQELADLIDKEEGAGNTQPNNAAARLKLRTEHKEDSTRRATAGDLLKRITNIVEVAEVQIGDTIKEADEIGQAQADLIRVVILEKLETLKQKIHYSALKRQPTGRE
jgi:hypothetical protein